MAFNDMSEHFIGVKIVAERGEGAVSSMQEVFMQSCPSPVPHQVRPSAQPTQAAVPRVATSGNLPLNPSATSGCSFAFVTAAAPSAFPWKEDYCPTNICDVVVHDLSSTVL